MLLMQMVDAGAGFAIAFSDIARTSTLVRTVDGGATWLPVSGGRSA